MSLGHDQAQHLTNRRREITHPPLPSGRPDIPAPSSTFCSRRLLGSDTKGCTARSPFSPRTGTANPGLRVLLGRVYAHSDSALTTLR